MADFEVEKEYSEQLRKLETTDPAHADLFNSMFSTLINNDAYLNEQNNKIKQPEFDDSGSIDEIVDFPSVLSSMVSKMSIFKFLSNLKAGLKFVLHTGQIVNNCVTDRSDLPGSAHNDKVLMDKYLALSSDLGAQTLLPKLMISPPYTENLDLNAITSGFYFSYVLDITNGPSISGATGGEAVFVFSFNTYPILSKVSFHGVQILFDIKRNNVYYRNHFYGYLSWLAWKMIA